MKLTYLYANYDRGPKVLCVVHDWNVLPLRAVLAHPLKAWRYLHGERNL